MVGQYINWKILLTAKLISGLVSERYWSAPITHQYSVGSMEKEQLANLILKWIRLLSHLDTIHTSFTKDISNLFVLK